MSASEYDPARDGHESYIAAIEEIGRRVRAGEPVPSTGYFGQRHRLPADTWLPEPPYDPDDWPFL